MFGRRVESTWEVGAPVRYTGRDGKLSDSGVVLESDPPRRLVFTWRVEFDDALRNEGYSRVTFELEPLGGEVKLTVIHDELREDSGVSRGSPAAGRRRSRVSRRCSRPGVRSRSRRPRRLPRAKPRQSRQRAPALAECRESGREKSSGSN